MSFPVASTMLPLDRDFRIAFSLLRSAASRGHLLAIHKLGHMYANGIGVARNCEQAVIAFRKVAESSGPWRDEMAESYALYKKGNYIGALGMYLRLAEQGYILAQKNAAAILASGVIPTKRRDDSDKEFTMPMENRTSIVPGVLETDSGRFDVYLTLLFDMRARVYCS
jgi:hypothetical protein